MTFSKLGAAITFNVEEEVFNWLCDAERPIEVQDFTSPNILNSDFTGLVLEYKDKLKSHKGTIGLHGPFFGLDLGNREIELQKLISKRLLVALDICEQLDAKYMAKLHQVLRNTKGSLFASSTTAKIFIADVN